jgi:hypothetical protein
MMAAVDGPLSVELAVGLPGELSLTGGGRDLDNYLFPLAQRLGPRPRATPASPRPRS